MKRAEHKVNRFQKVSHKWGPNQFFQFCTLLYVHSSIAISLMGKRELVALLNLSSWCLVMVERLFLAVPQGCLRFVIVVFPDHTHLLFFTRIMLHIVNFVLHFQGLS